MWRLFQAHFQAILPDGVNATGGPRQLYESLKADQAKLDKLEPKKQTPNLRQHEANLLLHDAVAVTRAGLIAPDQRAFVQDLLARTAKGHLPTVEELEQLDQIMEGAIAKLEGALPAEGTAAPPAPTTLADKQQPALDGGRAAIMDVGVAYVERPRTWMRLEGVVKAVEAQQKAVDQELIPANEAARAETQQKITAREAALKAEGKDPAADPELQALKSELQGVEKRLGDLHALSGDLKQARLDGLRNLSEIRTIVANELERLKGIGGARGQLQTTREGLGKLEGELKDIEAKVQKREITPAEGEKLIGEKRAAAEKLKTDAIAGMDALIALYKKRGGSKGSIAMLEAQRDKLKAMGSADVAAVLTAIKASETVIKATLDKEVANGKLAPREREALLGLANDVDETVKAHQLFLAQAEKSDAMTALRKAEAENVVYDAAKDDAKVGLMFKALIKDDTIDSAEIRALRKYVDAGLGKDKIEKFLTEAGMSPQAAKDLAGWMTADQAAFDRTFGLKGKFPISMDLVKGADGTYGIKDHSGFDPSTNPYTVEPPKALDHLRTPTVTSAPTEAEFESQRGDTIKAQKYIVTVRGVDIPVYVPVDGTKDKSLDLPSLEEVTKALSVLPEAELKAIKKIQLEPEPKKKDDGTISTAIADAGSGRIRFFPKSTAWTQEYCDSTAIHEGSHLWSDSFDDDVDDSKAWKDAKDADGVAPSRYANSSSAEDFAEAVTLYVMGGKDDPALRAKYGHRFALIDKLMAGEKP